MVDYSKWEKVDCSSDEDEKDEFAEFCREFPESSADSEQSPAGEKVKSFAELQEMLAKQDAKDKEKSLTSDSKRRKATGLSHWAFYCCVAVTWVHATLGVMLFNTGEPRLYAISEELNFHERRFHLAWGGWKFCGFLHMALASLGAKPDFSNAAAMTGCFVFDILGAMDHDNWPFLQVLACLHFAAAVTSVLGHRVLGVAVNAALLVGGFCLLAVKFWSMFAQPFNPYGNTHAAPEEKLTAAWLGWALCSSMFYVLVNTDADLGLANSVTMVYLFCFDLMAVSTGFFTRYALIFVAADLFVAISSLFAPLVPLRQPLEQAQQPSQTEKKPKKA